MKNKKLYKIIGILLGFILIFFLFFAVLSIVNEKVLRPQLYYPRNTTTYPKVGNDFPIRIDNEKRIVNGLLTQKGEILVVLFHGNGALINDFQSFARSLNQAGLSTLLIEYPGFGLSASYQTTEKNIYSDCQKMIEHIVANYSYSKSNLRFIGRSLGTGVAVEMVKRFADVPAVLISPFTSIPAVAHHSVLPVLPYLIFFDRFSNSRKATSIDSAILLIHGEKDTFVPHSMSLSLNQKFSQSELISIPNGNHLNLIGLMTDSQWDQLIHFIFNR